MKTLFSQQAAPPARPPMSPEMQQLLNQLQDIQEPAAIGWWPPAPGWWLLAGTALALLTTATLLAIRMRRKRLANRYRIEGIRLLKQVDRKQPQAVEAINTLLKRVAVVTFGRACCASLTGQEWIDFLEHSAQLPTPEGARRALLQGLYSPQRADAADVDTLQNYAIDWVRKHQLDTPVFARDLEASSA